MLRFLVLPGCVRRSFLYVATVAKVTLLGMHLALVLAACDDVAEEEFRWEGEVGQATEADIAGWTPFVEVRIGEYSPHSFLVDTGAPLTHADTAVYDLDGLVEGDFDAFGLRFYDRPIVPIALFGDEEACDGTQRGGLLGGDVLRAFSLAGDYLSGKLWLFDELAGDVPTEAEVGAAATVPMQVRGGGRFRVGDDDVVDVPATRVVVDLDVEGVTVPMLLDTGASYVSISPTLVDLDDGRPTLGEIAIRTARGEEQIRVTRLRSVAPGGAAEVASVPAIVLPDDDLLAAISDEAGVALRGLLGGSYLREFVFVIDYPAEELRLARYAEADHIDRREFIGPGFDVEPCGDGFYVGEIYEDTGVGDDHDIRVGDRVIAIGGETLAGKSTVEVEDLYRGVAPGTVLAFRLNRWEGDDEDRPDGTEDLEILDLLPDYR